MKLKIPSISVSVQRPPLSFTGSIGGGKPPSLCVGLASKK